MEVAVPALPNALLPAVYLGVVVGACALAIVSTRWIGGKARHVARRLDGPTGRVVDGLEHLGLLQRRRPEPVPPVLLALELRRLAGEVRRIEAGSQPNPAARLAAAYAAYDHVLVQLCATADVPTPVGLLPLDPRHRLALETDLVATGIDW